jgi:hypothetical protein
VIKWSLPKISPNQFAKIDLQTNKFILVFTVNELMGYVGRSTKSIQMYKYIQKKQNSYFALHINHMKIHFYKKKISIFSSLWNNLLSSISHYRKMIAKYYFIKDTLEPKAFSGIGTWCRESQTFWVIVLVMWRKYAQQNVFIVGKVFNIRHQ